MTLEFHCVMPKTRNRALWRQVEIGQGHLLFYRRDGEDRGYGVFEKIEFVIEDGTKAHR